MDFIDLTIQRAIEGLNKKEFSSTELTKYYLTRIKKFDDKIHAFLTICEDTSLKQAKQADDQIAKGINKPLLGIPMAIKDLFSTKDIRTTAGSKIIDNYIPPYNATAVKRLIESGAVIIGKTNQDAWGHGSSGENTDTIPARNPYDLDRVPGGSSSGSAAAVSSNMCLAATGTDTGSSIRLPAAYCNLVGIKPTYGRVSRFGIIAMASSFDSIGHITKTVHDCALIYEITAGRDSYDATTPDIPVPKYTSTLGKNIKGLKIGLPKEYFNAEGFDPKVKAITLTAIKKIEELGAHIQEISLPHTDYAMACYYILVPSEISSNLARFDGIRYGHERKTFGDEAKRRIMLGTHTLSSGYYGAYYLKASKVRTLIKKDFEDAFKNVDVIIGPSSPIPPFKIGEKTDNPVQMYLMDIFTCPVNIAGIPAINVPCGFTDGLPAGLQIIGPQFKEERLFEVAYAYEQKTEWYKQKPKL